MAHTAQERIYPGSSTAVLFIHGILGSPTHFRDFLPLLDPSWSFYNILLEGHGKDAVAFGAASMEKWQTQVMQMVQKLCREYTNVMLVGHSMGSLLALEAALVYPQIRQLFLLAVPLGIFITPTSSANAFKVTLGHVRPDDKRAVAAQRACSVAPDRRLWHYAPWISRYLELFHEIRWIRPRLSNLQVPCVVVQSRKDELVSKASFQYVQRIPGASCLVLEHSGHFYYDEADYALLLQHFSQVCNTLKQAESPTTGDSGSS